MNFFRRRKILRQSNYLELIPVKLMEDRVTEEGRRDILMPRFTSNFWRDIYRNSKKGEYIYIHLDQLGSIIWQLIDGNRNVSDICIDMIENYPGQIHPIDETEKRIMQFLSLLYQQRYISFRQILDKKS